MDSIYQQCGLHSTSSSHQHVPYSVTYLCALCRSPTANRTPRCFQISNQCKTIPMPDGIHITNMNLDDEKPAPPWGHCGSQKAKQELHVNLAGTRTTYWSHVTRTMSNFHWGVPRFHRFLHRSQRLQCLTTLLWRLVFYFLGACGHCFNAINPLTRSTDRHTGVCCYCSLLAKLLRFTTHWLGKYALLRDLLLRRNRSALGSCFTLSALRMLQCCHSNPHSGFLARNIV